MVKFLINTLLFYSIIINNALSLFNEPKTYEKLYTYFGYSYQSITNNNLDYNQQNHNLSVGIGYNIYYKYNDVFDSFVGLQLETRLPVSPFFGKTNQSHFYNVMSLDMIFGAKFKINNEIALQPFFLFGFNVNYAKYNQTTMVKELVFDQEKYDNDYQYYTQYQEFQKNRQAQRDLLQNNQITDEEYNNWVNENKPTTIVEEEPDINDPKYKKETDREIENNKNGKEMKIGLDIGFGLDAILYDRFMIGMEYKYLSVQSGIETKIHQFSTKFGIMFNI